MDVSLLKNHTNHNIINKIQMVLQDSLPNWYQDCENAALSPEFTKEIEFRWSKHLIYNIKGFPHHHTQGILVKYLKFHDDSGRTQDAVRPRKNTHLLEFNALKLLYHNLGQRQIEGITAIRPLIYLSDLDAFAMEYSPGEHLRDLICRAAHPWSQRPLRSKTEKAIRNSGILLNRIHQINQGDCPKNCIFDSKKFIKQFNAKVDELLAIAFGSSVSRYLNNLRRQVNNLVPDIRHDITISYLHNDLYPDNLVLLPDERVYTVDTTLNEMGPVEMDVAKFLAGVETLKQQIIWGYFKIDSKFVKKLLKSFLDGYAVKGKISFTVLHLYRFMALLQRWKELVFVLKRLAPSFVSAAYQCCRVNPFMLKRLDAIWRDFSQEIHCEPGRYFLQDSKI